MPERIQRKRTRGWRMPPNTVYAGRGTVYGNPFKVGMLGVPDKAAAVSLFERALDRGDLGADHKRFVFAPEQLKASLGGKNLACWCGLDEPCHADILLRRANP